MFVWNMPLFTLALVLCGASFVWTVIEIRRTNTLRRALKQSEAPNFDQAWWMLAWRRAHRGLPALILWFLGLDLVVHAFTGVAPTAPLQVRQVFAKIRGDFDKAIGLTTILFLALWLLAVTLEWRRHHSVQREEKTN